MELMELMELTSAKALKSCTIEQVERGWKGGSRENENRKILTERIFQRGVLPPLSP